MRNMKSKVDVNYMFSEYYEKIIVCVGGKERVIEV